MTVWQMSDGTAFKRRVDRSDVEIPAIRGGHSIQRSVWDPEIIETSISPSSFNFEQRFWT